MKYPLIEKWLGLEAIAGITSNGVPTKYTVDADELEAKLAEGFEVYADDSLVFNNLVLGDPKFEKYVALAIGKQPIKKKTREEAALELLEKIARDHDKLIQPEWHVRKAKEILEMK